MRSTKHQLTQALVECRDSLARLISAGEVFDQDAMDALLQADAVLQGG